MNKVETPAKGVRMNEFAFMRWLLGKKRDSIMLLVKKTTLLLQETTKEMGPRWVLCKISEKQAYCYHRSRVIQVSENEYTDLLNAIIWIGCYIAKKEYPNCDAPQKEWQEYWLEVIAAWNKYLVHENKLAWVDDLILVG